MLVDSHSHLEMREFDEDREVLIKRAKEGGVAAIVCVGINLSDSCRAVALADTEPMVYAAVGVHPHDVQGIRPDTYARLEALACSERVVAYGEIGLDFFRDWAPRAMQKERFAEQLEVAARLKKPVIIHSRDAHQETLDIIKASSHRCGGVFHCFSGDVDFARQCLEAGFYISIAGVVTFAKALTISDVVRFAPLSRMLLETDCPFLAPHPHRGKRNEPAFVEIVARQVAQIKGVTIAEVAAATSANASALFGI